MSDVSILMPVYNCERYVGEAIESIINQTYTNWELLIWDDGSTDGTRRLLENYFRKDTRIKVFFNEKNIGKIATLTNAYKLIKGRHVVFHDSDDISHPDRLRIQVETLMKDPSIGLVGCGFVMIDDKERILDRIIPACEHEDILESIKKSSPFHFPTVMFNREYLDQEKYLFRDFFGDNNEDVDLSFRILTNSRGKNINRVLYVYRILPNSISRKNVLRNPIFFYSIAKDLALARIQGQHDWLNDPVQSEEHLKKYERLRDRGNILIYANSVSYFLSYKMYKKAINASLLSTRSVSVFNSSKLVIITFIKIAGSLFKIRNNEVLDIASFLSGRAG